MGIIYFEEDFTLEVPKRHIDGLEEWEKVAVEGFQKWLRFWNLEAVKDNSSALSLVDFGMNAPRPTEETALSNLERQAQRSLKMLQSRDLEPVYLQVLALERYYLANYEKHEFRVRYWEFIQINVATKGELTTIPRYTWIAERMGFYNGITPNKRLVVECLERAEARIELAELRDEPLDLTVDISALLPVRRVAKTAA